MVTNTEMGVVTSPRSKCPKCRTDLKLCLISEDTAVLMCPVLNCSYPFCQDSDHLQVANVTQKEILQNVATRMRQANLDPKGL